MGIISSCKEWEAVMKVVRCGDIRGGLSCVSTPTSLGATGSRFRYVACADGEKTPLSTSYAHALGWVISGMAPELLLSPGYNWIGDSHTRLILRSSCQIPQAI